ncbi:hypothetical protein GSI_04320 [Ganoderma sinense ZZ0214-1]|uniref:Uncharacterized protein n=1 Tax=Ganoderma sinense ZZ0214-1 TaxID=1077348 RepID=A0A2G8SIT7_9APHY|nr:hypothetical protein GSI_04320 [Ganoderma sinense ZZ0214-1]
MYALSTLDWAIDIRLLWNDLHTLTLTGLPATTPVFGFSSPPLLVLQGITSVICIILGDAVVCWRACVVWGSGRLTNAIGLFWVLGSVGVFTAWSVMSVGLYYQNQSLPAPIEALVEHAAAVNALAFSWSAAMNVWATAMISVKAWLQRRDLKRHLGSTGLAVHDALMLLADFGVIYTVFMLLNVIVLIPSLQGGTFFYYVTLFMQQITGMYPTAIIVLVALQKSHLDHQFTFPPSARSRVEDIESISFTVKPGQRSKETQSTSVTASTYDSPALSRQGHEPESQPRVLALRTAGMPISESIWESGAGKETGSPVTVEGVGRAT